MEPPLDLFQGVVPLVVAAKTGSIRGAARRLGVSASSVTKAIQRAEARLGVVLLTRSARSVRPTVEGEAIIAQFSEAVRRALAGYDLALNAQKRPQGLIKLTAPRSLARCVVAPAMPKLLQRYPALKVHMNLTDTLAPLADSGVDVALRIGPLQDSSAKARRLAQTRWVTVAAPAYLGRFGPPETPEALRNHACLRFLAPDGRPRDWQFAKHKGLFPVDGPLVFDDAEGLIAAAKSSAGIVQAMAFMVQRELQEGTLLPLLDAWSCPGPTIWALTRTGRQRAARVRALLTFLQELFSSWQDA